MRAPCETFLRRRKAAIVLSLALFIEGGCAIPHQVSFSDRCAQAMHAAFPSASIKVTGGEARDKSITGVTARVTGVRTDLGKNARLPRELAVSCRFENGILTEFHWTKGPLR